MHRDIYHLVTLDWFSLLIIKPFVACIIFLSFHLSFFRSFSFVSFYDRYCLLVFLKFFSLFSFFLFFSYLIFDFFWSLLLCRLVFIVGKIIQKKFDKQSENVCGRGRSRGEGWMKKKKKFARWSVQVCLFWWFLFLLVFPPPIIIINSFFFLLAVDTVVNIYIYIYKRRCEFALIWCLFACLSFSFISVSFQRLR